ncbi:hypothetical protein F4803DRAFT_542954 [Xylaria telfairii]|nr:hypothetical protein F4803DRAFT_542954 [Xylaria telfairii]
MSTAQMTSYAVDGLPEHPEMLRKKLRRNRKYGRHEFERFDDVASEHACLGSATIGKVSIDCRFLLTKSKWGVMGGQSNQAGIIYLDLTFHEPKDCRLHSATVTVSLDDEHEELHKRQRGLPSAMSRAHPVQMTDYYGPKSFMGPEKSVHEKKGIHFNPNIQAGGFGAGFGELRKEQISTSSSRWRFSGQLLSSRNSPWKYNNTLQWQLSENDFEKQSTHNNVLHTAFAFHHGCQPFFLKVDVEGKLRAPHGQLRNMVKKFFASTKNDGGALTLINFGDQHIFTKPLDYRARNLQLEMEQANLQSIPIEVPDPQRVEFRSITPNLQSSSAPINNTTMPSSWSWPYTLGGNSSATLQTLEQSPQLPTSSSLLKKEGNAIEEQAMAPIPENLARIINSNLYPPENPLKIHSMQQLNTDQHGLVGMKALEGVSEENAMNERKLKKPIPPEGPHKIFASILYLLELLAFLKRLIGNFINWTAATLNGMAATSYREHKLPIEPPGGWPE